MNLLYPIYIGASNISTKISTTSTVVAELVDVKTGFMKRDELLFVYSECSRCLHAQNPYGKGVNYEYYKKKIPIWINKIVKSLNTHQIKLLNDDRLYIVHMKEERDNKVHLYEFERETENHHAQ